MMFEVKRSEPVRTIMTKPIGKINAAIIRMRPGAFSWYQGAALTERVIAQP